MVVFCSHCEEHFGNQKAKNDSEIVKSMVNINLGCYMDIK